MARRPDANKTFCYDLDRTKTINVVHLHTLFGVFCRQDINSSVLYSGSFHKVICLESISTGIMRINYRIGLEQICQD